MDDVADEETDSETHRKELRIFKVKRDMKHNTGTKEATSAIGGDDSLQSEERTSVREIAQHFGALHEPLFAAKARNADEDSSRVSSLAKATAAPPPSPHSELEPRFPQRERNNQSSIESAASLIGPKSTAQFSGQTEDLVLKSKTVSTSVTSSDSPLLSINTSADRCEFPLSMGAQISQPSVPPREHHLNKDAQQHPHCLAEVIPQTITNHSGTPVTQSESPTIASKMPATTNAATKIDEHDLCSEAYNHIVQFITHSSMSKPRGITDVSGTTIDDNHQMAIPDADSTKESVSSPGLTEASDSCALIGSAQTDVDSDAEVIGDDGCETEEANKQAVTQKAVITDISTPILPRPRNANQEPPRVQTVVMKKKRSNECFADAKVDGSKSKSCGNHSRAESKTLIISDPQTAAVSATISLGRSKKLSLQKGGKCSRATSSAVATFAAPSQAVTIQKPMFANFASTLSTRPVLVVHPAQKSFSQTAVHTFKKFSLGEPNLKFATSSTVTSDNTASDLTNKPTDKPDSQSDTSTLNSAISRVSRSSDDSKESLANRLSRGLVDLTQGSSDRLQRWKSKLQTGRRPKDTSEPPPIIRNMPAIHEPSGHCSDAEVVLNWAPSRFIPLQPSPSEKFGSNTNKSAFTTQILRPRILHPSLSATDILRPADADKDVSLTDSEMEHRTLRQRDENNSKSTRHLTMHYQNMKNLQHLVQTIEGYDNVTNSNLPPPVRITPYSGMKPQDSDIIRPVAFRPFVPKKPETRQSMTSASSSFYVKHEVDSSNSRQSSADQYKRSSHLNESNCITLANNRPRAIYQPSTSTEPSPSSTQYPVKSPKCENEENDYDVVPEYIDREKLFTDDSGSSDNYSILYQTPFHSNQKGVPSQINSSASTTFAVNNVNLPTNIPKKSPSSHHIYGSNASSGSRHSSGIHVTPSPSDSGIVDYESIIRDKENELSTVRSTMEQNEEIIIRVYQEKERMWKEQLADLKQKLQASQQGESALRQQIQRCNEQRDQFQATISNLSSDKQGLQRKCLQIEREMFQIRERFDELLRARDAACESCRRQSSSLDSDRRARPPPVPMSRQTKESNVDRDLRAEVEQLRGEISTLRDTLTEQIGLFTDERRRWDLERNKMITSNNMRSTAVNEARVAAADSRIPSSGAQCIVSGDRLI